MLTDAVNLFLLNRGCKSYLNNFTLKMKAPVTQEEIDYRNEFTNKINAISSLQGLFTDVEDKARRLTILKALVSSLHLGDEVLTEIQNEIEAAEEAAKKAKEAEDLENAEDGPGTVDAPSANNEENDLDLDLSPMPDAEIEEDLEDPIDMNAEESEESVDQESESRLLLEEQDLFEDDDLPTPEEADDKRDFTENY